MVLVNMVDRLPLFQKRRNQPVYPIKFPLVRQDAASGLRDVFFSARDWASGGS